MKITFLCRHFTLITCVRISWCSRMSIVFCIYPHICRFYLHVTVIFVNSYLGKMTLSFLLPIDRDCPPQYSVTGCMFCWIMLLMGLNNFSAYSRNPIDHSIQMCCTLYYRKRLSNSSCRECDTIANPQCWWSDGSQSKHRLFNHSWTSASILSPYSDDLQYPLSCDGYCYMFISMCIHS